MNRFLKVCLYISFFAMVFGCSRQEAAEDKSKVAPIQTYKVSSRSIKSYITTTGTVQPDMEGGAKILSPLAGAIDRIYVRNGDLVKKGAQLIAVRSTDVSDAFAGYQSSLAQLKQTEKTYKLNKELFEIGAVVRNDVLTSESAYQQALAATEGFKKKLAIYGVNPDAGFSDKVIINAPIDGRVADISAHIGDRFDTSAVLMSIANPKRIYIVANVYDTDAVKLHKGMEVTFLTDLLPNKEIKGRIINISDVEDPDTKTVKTYITMPDMDKEGLRDIFKQNTFLNLSIQTGEAVMTEIPKTAMIFKKGVFLVNQKTGDKIVPIEVKPVREASDKTMAVYGLKDGMEIVTSAIELERP